MAAAKNQPLCQHGSGPVQNGIEPYLDSILDVLTDGIYISDRTGKTLKINRRYEQLTGLNREEMVGRLVTDLVKEGKYDVVLNPDIVRTGQPKTMVQTTMVGRKVVLDGYPVFDQDGKVALVVTFVRDVTQLTQLKEQVAHQQELIERYNKELRCCAGQAADRSNLIVESPAMAAVMKSIATVSRTDATVLLLGETGVGKDVLARLIHDQSERASQPFFKIDCTALPQNLVETELFGYDPGAFSGAHARGKAGLLEMADRGTLFLDEIGELPLSMQAKLLRVLQEQEIVRIGSTKVRKVDVRFIAATNRNLEEAVKEGVFRRDLFYRLRVAVLKVPPLRERKEDILPLARHFLQRFNTKYRRKVSLSLDAERVFCAYDWPGNVREMENLVQSLVVTRERDIVEPGDLPPNMLTGKKIRRDRRCSRG